MEYTKIEPTHQTQFEINQIEIKAISSDQSQDYGYAFIENPPSWILRYGIGLIALALGLFLCLSYLIKYPDKITATGIVTASQPPIEHFANQPGVIKKLHVKDGDKINKGAVIAYIENTMDINDLLKLKGFLTQYDEVTKLEQYISLNIPSDLQLGDVSNEYNSLVLTYENLQSVLKQMGVFEQIKTLRGEIANNKKLNEVIQKDQNLTKEELALIEKDFGRNKTLNDDGVVSDLDKEKSNVQLLQYQKNYNQTNQTIIQNQIKSKQLELEIQRLSEERKIKINEILYQVKTDVNAVKQKIKLWEEAYIITAKIAGIVNMKSDITTQRYLTTDEAVATVIPYKSYKQKHVKVIVPNANIGKIKFGTAAILKFDAYPYKEYGIVKSSVKKIAQLPEKDDEGKNQYEVLLTLEDTILTSYGKLIPYEPMAGLTADIITKDKSILERIFDNFLNLINND